MDWGLFHVEPEFYPTWSKYHGALKHRNAILKSRPDRQLFESTTKFWQYSYVLGSFSSSIWMNIKVSCFTIAVPTLQALLKSKHNIQAVLTQPDRPKGRGKKLVASLAS